MEFLQNKYTKWYLELMETRSARPTPTGYTEKHHKLPRAFGGSNSGSNIVKLTAREHFIAHLLLPKMLTGAAQKKMQFALMFMMGKGRGKGRELYVPSGKIFEIYRKTASIANTGRTWTAEQRIKMLVMLNSRPPPSTDTRAKMSVASKGRKLSTEAKEKIRQKATGRKMSAATIEKLKLIHTGAKRPPRSDEWKVKQRLAQIGRKDPPSGFANRSKAHAGENNPRAKTWMLEREDGSTFEVKGLKPWCKENGVNIYFLMTHQCQEFRLLK